MPAPRYCNALFEDLYGGAMREHICTEWEDHDGPHRGHATSRDLVPEEAEHLAVAFVGKVAVWPCEDAIGIWVAYVYPPSDLMSQGRTRDEAIESVGECVRLVARWRREIQSSGG